MWNGKRVSVVLMTYAERDSIRAVIDGFFATGVRRRGRSSSTTTPSRAPREEVARTPGRLVHEPRQGYGHATRRGLVEATRRPDRRSPSPTARSCPEDITKLLVYSGECDVVFGTRTTRELIWPGANMDWFLRWGNWAVAKLVEVLFNTSHLSDVGCTYRLLRRDARASTSRPTMTRRRQPRRRRDHAADDRLGRALRRGAGQLPAARGHLVGHRASRSRPIGVGLRMIQLILRFRRRGAAPARRGRRRSSARRAA